MAVRGRSSKSSDTSSVNPNNRNEIEAGQPTKDSNRKKEKPVVFAGPEQTVYEGEKVQLEGFCNLDQSEKANNNIVYDWYFISDKSDTEISQKEFKDIKNPILQLHMLIFGRIRKMIRTLKIKIFVLKNIRHSLNLLTN